MQHYLLQMDDFEAFLQHQFLQIMTLFSKINVAKSNVRRINVTLINDYMVAYLQKQNENNYIVSLFLEIE